MPAFPKLKPRWTIGRKIAAAFTALASLGLAIMGYAALGAHGRTSLVGDDLGAIRREALALYPVGTNVRDVAKGLLGLGFHCSFRPHPAENATAATLNCDSSDRRVSPGSHNFIDVIARNGNLTDIAVTDALKFERANAAHPNPAPGDHAKVAVTPQDRANFDAFDKLVDQVMWRHPYASHAPAAAKTATGPG